MSHTEGKLTLGKHGVIYGGPFREYVRGSAQDQFAMVTSPHEDEIEQGITQEENARRLVACWNACEGIPLEQLECDQPTFVQMLLERQTLKQQRDELLAALLSAYNFLQGFPKDPEKIELSIRIAALIEKYKEAE